MSKQIIYHGSYCKVEKPEIKEGKYTKDFGTGFYCTILEEQAEKWAEKYETPTINIYEYNDNPDLIYSYDRRMARLYHKIKKWRKT